MAIQDVEQNGHLSQHPLGELIREAAATGLSGAFRLAQASAKSVVYFEAGNLIFAVSNVRSLRLSECARRWKFVTQQQLKDAGTPQSDFQLGMSLVDSGALSSEKLSELFAVQSSAVLRPMLLWTDGTWTFDPRVRLVEDIRIQMDLPEMLTESARRLPAEFAIKRFPDANELFGINGEPPANLALQPVEGFVLSRIGAQIRLHELLSISGLPEAETFNSLYVLALGGFITRDGWIRAFSDETISRFRAIDAAVLKSTKESGATRRPVTTRPSAHAIPKAKVPEPALSKEEEIDRFFFRVEAAEDFYDVLAVTQSADSTAIKKAYHTLARRFHPDAFHQEAGSPLHARLQTTFARVAQAYEMLKDPKLRATYDLRLQAEKKMRRPSSLPPLGNMSQNASGQNTQSSGATGSVRSDSSQGQQNAEDNFQKGMHAFKMGNTSLAISFLSEAVRNFPNEARYRAAYGQALASNKQSRLKAEAELKAAVSLDGKNLSYRLMLAEFYKDYGMKRRAEGEAQKILANDPQNADALRLIHALSTGD